MIEISSNDDLSLLLKVQGIIVILDVYAMWCKPCGRMLQILPRLEESLGSKAVIIAKLDFDTQKSLVQFYNVTKIPTFIFFKDGQEVHRFEGIKTLQEIEHIVNSL